ncbi:hypothetical protein B0T22DRAFT_126670 [Podospora appendiculata]|uniref:Uncharacterized protein n=1 Tax=Podospora appendiculata TaxID=314037 RepID=A0AAE0X7Z3_9PEZI|nr:hypothetical protein B0T22DRAFT_126670 [Podospora appendiculata]
MSSQYEQTLTQRIIGRDSSEEGNQATSVQPHPRIESKQTQATRAPEANDAEPQSLHLHTSCPHGDEDNAKARAHSILTSTHTLYTTTTPLGGIQPQVFRPLTTYSPPHNLDGSGWMDGWMAGWWHSSNKQTCPCVPASEPVRKGSVSPGPETVLLLLDGRWKQHCQHETSVLERSHLAFTELHSPARFHDEISAAQQSRLEIPTMLCSYAAFVLRCRDLPCRWWCSSHRHRTMPGCQLANALDPFRPVPCA